MTARILDSGALASLLLAFAATTAMAAEPTRVDWPNVRFLAGDLLDPLEGRGAWESKDVFYLQSPHSPGILIRMKSRRIQFFGGLDRYGAEPPKWFWIKTRAGARTLGRGQSVRGAEMTGSWILTSFQGSRGWERFDVPWFLSLQKRPALVVLASEGLRIEFDGDDTGYVFSMPLYGYDKLPQWDNDFSSLNKLPSLGLKPWEWTGGLPTAQIERCDWWAGVAKAYPAGFQESFRIDPGADEIVFRQDYRWLSVRDDWLTHPIRFAVLPPSVGLAWKFPGFPMRFSSPVHDPGYFTAFGPLVGAVDTDRVEISMRVLQYMNEMEWPVVPDAPSEDQSRALALIAAGVRAKFPDSRRYVYDHGGPENFCWNLAGDVWYPRALPFAPADLQKVARNSLAIYMRNDVLRPHSPYHGKYILTGPGVGSWGGWGDAGKLMTDALQPVWAYGQFAGGWDLVRERWPLIRRFFITPEEADWVSFGRYAIAEIGDEAAPCSAYARMAWAVGDLDEYLLGAYTFSREMIHLYVKQRAARFFYEHQPYNQYEPMPPHIYPTDLWGSTSGWQVDGPAWGHLRSGEHQSANRWIRFQDPDIGRFYRDRLSNSVGEELSWYEQAGRAGRTDVYLVKRYQEWLSRDNPHMMPSLLRLRSFLLDTPLPPGELAPAAMHSSGWGAADVARGYAVLRKLVPVRNVRLIPRTLSPSPFVLGLERRGNSAEVLNTVQDISEAGISLEPRWQGWGRGRSNDGYLGFGSITGDFAGKVSGAEGSRWISPGCRVVWAESVRPRNLSTAQYLLGVVERTPIATIGPFSNRNDREITEFSYPPEKQLDFSASYAGLQGQISWQFTSLSLGRLDMRPVLTAAGGTAALAYAAQFIWSPAAMQVFLAAQHQGGIIAWINQDEVLRYHGIHRPAPDDSLHGLGRLQQGWNSLVVKVESFTGEYSFRFRLLGLDRQPIPGLKYSLVPANH